MRDRIENLCDLIDHCRVRLDDVAPVDVAPEDNLALLTQAAEEKDESDLLWKDAELTVFANNAVREVAIRTKCIRDAGRNTAGLTSFAVTAGTVTVPMHERVLLIKRVWWNNGTEDTLLTTFSERQADETFSQWRADTATKPAEVCLRQVERALLLYPIPTENGTLTIECVREPTVEEELHESVDVPVIPRSYLPACVNWMCAEAYLKNDADTRDPQAAERFERLFTEAVGPRPWAQLLELEHYSMGYRTPRASFY